MKLNKRQILFFSLTLLWMGVIFWFSAHTGSESSAQSAGIVNQLIHFLFPHYSEWPIHRQEHVADIVTIIVRKSGHATEYLVLGLLFLGCQSWNYSFHRTFFTSWILTVCYAATDEFHQYFVPDRACMFTDVLIDSAGAATGLLLVLILLLWRRKQTAYD